jgi:hypothetical protein
LPDGSLTVCPKGAWKSREKILLTQPDFGDATRQLRRRFFIGNITRAKGLAHKATRGKNLKKTVALSLSSAIVSRSQIESVGPIQVDATHGMNLV